MISTKKHIMGRPVAKTLKPIIIHKSINMGYGKGQLRPNNSRDPLAECRQFGMLIMLINGMSGQLTG